MKKTIVLFALAIACMQIVSCKSKQASKDDIMFTKTKNDGNERYKNTPLEQAFNKLKSGTDLSSDEMMQYASRIDTRADLYQLLSDFNRVDQFPAIYNTFEKAGESILTGWLQYPTELDTIPSEIKLVKKVTYNADGNSSIYYVYKFKTEEPHWAAKDGWMLGVVGPYLDGYKPYDWTGGTFSRFKKMGETTPDEEVDWCYKNVYKKNPSAQ